MPSSGFEKLFLGATSKHFEFAKQLRNNPTTAEESLWKYLSNKQLLGLKFRRQHPISNFILDFYCNEIRLSIELDGAVHNEVSQHEYDQERTRSLNEINITEIRFYNNQVMNDIDSVISKIKNVAAELKSQISNSNSHPQPPVGA